MLKQTMSFEDYTDIILIVILNSKEFWLEVKQAIGFKGEYLNHF